MERTLLITDLEAAIAEQRRCQGADPVGCLTAARRVIELRAQLRDDTAFLSHLLAVISAPTSARQRRSSR
jgi:hypothetical protein